MFLKEGNIPIKYFQKNNIKQDSLKDNLLNIRNDYKLKIRQEKIFSKIMNDRTEIKKQNLKNNKSQINKIIQDKFNSLINENEKIEFLSFLFTNDIQNFKRKFIYNIELNSLLSSSSLLYLIESDDNNLYYIGQKKENFEFLINEFQKSLSKQILQNFILILGNLLIYNKKYFQFLTLHLNIPIILDSIIENDIYSFNFLLFGFLYNMNIENMIIYSKYFQISVDLIGTQNEINDFDIYDNLYKFSNCEKLSNNFVINYEKIFDFNKLSNNHFFKIIMAISGNLILAKNQDFIDIFFTKGLLHYIIQILHNIQNSQSYQIEVSFQILVNITCETYSFMKLIDIDFYMNIIVNAIKYDINVKIQNNKSIVNSINVLYNLLSTNNKFISVFYKLNFHILILKLFHNHLDKEVLSTSLDIIDMFIENTKNKFTSIIKIEFESNKIYDILQDKKNYFQKDIQLINKINHIINKYWSNWCNDSDCVFDNDLISNIFSNSNK